MHIALDAMGGDHGPEELIAGALLAVKQAQLKVSLVGDEVLLRSFLDKIAIDSKISSAHPDRSFLAGCGDE